MRPTFIIECNQCGSLLLATANQKTRTCPYCTTRLDVRKAKRVASAESAFEASEMLRNLKNRRANSK